MIEDLLCFEPHFNWTEEYIADMIQIVAYQYDRALYQASLNECGRGLWSSRNYKWLWN